MNSLKRSKISRMKLRNSNKKFKIWLKPLMTVKPTQSHRPMWTFSRRDCKKHKMKHDACSLSIARCVPLPSPSLSNWYPNNLNPNDQIPSQPTLTSTSKSWREIRSILSSNYNTNLPPLKKLSGKQSVSIKNHRYSKIELTNLSKS